MVADKLLLTDKEVAAMLNMCRKSVWNHEEAGRIPKSINIGPRCKRWRRSDILSFIEKGEVTQ